MKRQFISDGFLQCSRLDDHHLFSRAQVSEFQFGGATTTAAAPRTTDHDDVYSFGAAAATTSRTQLYGWGATSPLSNSSESPKSQLYYRGEREICLVVQ